MTNFTTTDPNASKQPRTEILQVAEMVAREKSIDREEVLSAMEQAIQKAAKAKYGHQHDIRASIDRKTGEVQILNCRTVVEEVEDPVTQLTLEQAQREKPDAEMGEVLVDELPAVEYGRVGAQSARQVIFQKVRDAERMRQYEEYKERVGEIINGVVRRVEYGNVIVDLGKCEGIVRRDQLIPREAFRTGDRIRVYIAEVNKDAKTHIIQLSRTKPDFMAKLFEQEVPEIYDGNIEIKAVARDPGSRAKIAVYSPDPSIDPVGACVGMRGSRVQAVVSELQGEKVDIVPWSSNEATFVVNALAPAEVIKVVIDEEANRVDVVVAEDQLSLAIGRRGQNVRLASQLTGWSIDILTEDEEANRRTEEHSKRVQEFMTALDVDEMIGQLLSSEGFVSLEEIAGVPVEEFLNIEGFDEDIAQEIQERAKNYLEQSAKNILEDCRKAGMTDDLAEFPGLKPEMLQKLVSKGIKTLDDFADLAGDEFLEIIGMNSMTQDEANKMIMDARAHWFEDEK